MTGWVIMAVMALAVGLGLWRWFRRDMGALQFLGAALLLALAGYAWQGRPGLAGTPKDPGVDQNRPDSDFAELRRDLFPQFNSAGAWLTTAEALSRSGNTGSAVNVIRNQLDQNPRDMMLWLGMADALIQHAGGQLTPASEMAFNRAAQVAPRHPAPRFFFALALMRLGQFEAADGYLAAVATMPEATDLWRDYVGRARQMAMQMQAAGPGGPPIQ